MGEVWSRCKMQMTGELDYQIVQLIVSQYYDDDEHWPVEEYAEEAQSIHFEEVLATQDDVVGFARVLTDAIEKVAASFDDAETAQVIKLTSFAIHGTTEFYNSGECIDYIIKRSDGKITIQETSNYMFLGAGSCEDYEAFCEMAEGMCSDAADQLSEEEFDPDEDYYVTYREVLTDRPEFKKPYPIERYHEAGKVYSANEMIIAYFEENGIPYDETTLASLTVEDVYAIMAGTYGKE